MPWSMEKQQPSQRAAPLAMEHSGASGSSQVEVEESHLDTVSEHDFLQKLLQQQQQQQPLDNTSEAHFQHPLLIPVPSSGESQLQQHQVAGSPNGYTLDQTAYEPQSLSFGMGQLECGEQQHHPGGWSSNYSMPIYSPSSGAAYSHMPAIDSLTTGAGALIQTSQGELQQQPCEILTGPQSLQAISDNETIFSTTSTFRSRQQQQQPDGQASSTPTRPTTTYTSAIHSQQVQAQHQSIHQQQQQQQQHQRMSNMFALREQQPGIQNMMQLPGDQASHYQQPSDFLLARSFLSTGAFQSQQFQEPGPTQAGPHRAPAGVSNGNAAGRSSSFNRDQMAYLSAKSKQRKNRSPFFMGGSANSAPGRSNNNNNKLELFGGAGNSSKSPESSTDDASNTERFSRKVFVGGLPPDIDEEEIKASFQRFGSLVVDWPHKIESKSYFPPKGYAFLLFNEEQAVQALIDACIQENDKLYLSVSSPTIKDKPVQIRPWRLSDADFVLDSTLALDPRKTVFVGGVPRPLKASELANIMNNFYGGVCYAGIDTDPQLKYPKGAGRVAFSNHQSYISAISGRFIHLHLSEIERRVEVKPYVLDDQFCDECQGARCGNKFAPFFCANIACLRYYCQSCWTSVHSAPGKEFHKPLVKEGTDRPRLATGNSYRWT